MAGPIEQRDLRAIPLKPGEHEGRSNYTFESSPDLELARTIARRHLNADKWLHGAMPDCYYPAQQSIWRGEGGFVYYPPKNAHKVCLAVAHPPHKKHRNVYHGTTIDRLASILENGLMLSGVGPAAPQNPFQTRHIGRIFTSPQWETALGYSHVCEHEGRRFKVVLKCLQDPRHMVLLEDPAANGEVVDGDYFYTTEPSSVVVFAVLFQFL
eukprot:TRINITY_DN14634_c0_g1_i1.p1 TRINITY_DN14634_c0_g1~~TRINITY_DN14634_c0_g1_i1.p1  ORF type:complete len:211 (+),score=30.59 TRINITY_DN14634_c0_g1_i1:41-673(+)